MVKEVLRDEPGYYNWMMDGDFPMQTKNVLTRIRLDMRNE
jgi:DNA polymerase-3 subunit epsilon